METAINNTNNIEKYWKILCDLPPKIKIALINKLSASLLQQSSTEEDKNKMLMSLAGAWQGDETAEEIIRNIRDSRSKNRDIDL